MWLNASSFTSAAIPCSTHCHGSFESDPQHYYMFPGLSAHSARSEAAFDLPEGSSSRNLKMTNAGSYSTLRQLESGLYSCMALPSASVFLPRSF
jgi:hypothetical protein